MTVVLTPVARSGYWRVEIAWPNRPPHFFGKFLSKAEAEKWIEQHRWLTRQRQEDRRPPPDMEEVRSCLRTVQATV